VPLSIEDYALIGDCETAALVGRDGSIDWLCLPRFDSPACFAALLGTPDNGRWLIAPAGEVSATRRRYREGTLVLETEHETATGVVTVTDAMPVRADAASVVRLVEGTRGRVRMRLELIIRFDYGSVIPWVRRTDDGLSALAGPDGVQLRTPVEVKGENFRSIAEFDVAAGERIPFELTWYASHHVPPAPIDVAQQIDEADKWWRQWSSPCSYEGDWFDAVLRSLITLKALTYAPTGGLVAAPTTSLPEEPGGVRNWDYRYCWIRDATFSLYALMTGGFLKEAKAWSGWLLRAMASHPADLRVLYGLAGERRLPELVLDWLPGYQGAVPVRIGNAAHEQFQLDVFGELMDSFHVARRFKIPLESYVWEVQKALVGYVEKVWEKPDEGIWEVRGPRRQFTHSKVLAWVALDRAVKAVERFGLEGPADQWRRTRERIHAEVCAGSFDARANTFVQYRGASEVDASLLMIPLVGFLPASDPRVLGTVKAVQERLMSDGFVQRYAPMPEVDGLPPGDAPFLPCTLWLADNLALQGRFDEAREIFERVLSVRNDVGLLAEEYDPVRQRLLGNFPQAFSHVGLINTARNLSKANGPAEHRQRA
jgi:GH15 family glucan-1,4-alpha-glucosidase